jgi:hypothetical protein
MAPGRRALVWLPPLGVVLLAGVALVVIWGGDLLIPLVRSDPGTREAANRRSAPAAPGSS